jgi:3-O-alpha-D-mannopyranosyl-alpha-D-mannopyranose xylosylphosphotransferase
MIAVLVLVYTAIDHFLPDSSLLSLAGGVYTSEPSAEQETVYAGQAEGTAPYHVGIGHAGVASSALPGVMPFKGDTTHVLVPITPLPPSPELLGSISTRQPHRVLSTYYLDGTYEAGSPAPQSQLDIVYLWVNSTSRFFQDALEAKAAEEKVGAARGRARRWRDNGELRPAIRSAVQHLGKALRRVHLLTGDYEFPLGEFRDRLPYEDEMEEGVEVLGWRAGQIPTWLDWDRVANAGVSAVAGANGKVAWHPHSEVFRLPRDHGMLDSRLRDDADGGKEEDKWREEAMPSFDSFEIESRVGWISGLSENL